MSNAQATADYWASTVQALQAIPVRCRVGLLNGRESVWARPFFSPSPGYIEGADLGPVPTQEIRWIEVESVEQRRRGRLVPDQPVDHSATLLDLFQRHGLRFEHLKHGYRILPIPVV